MTGILLDEQCYLYIASENFKAGMNQGLIIAAFSIFLEGFDTPKEFELLKDGNVKVGGEDELRKCFKKNINPKLIILLNI
mgnify:CR=1 FL=1